MQRPRGSAPPQTEVVRRRAAGATISVVRNLTLAAADPWNLEIITVVRGTRSSSERAAISRDVERGLLLRVSPGAYVERTAFGTLTPEAQHIVRVRAIGAVSYGPVLVSHWSAGVLHGIPVLRSRLTAVHITVPEDDDRHRKGVVTHHFLVDDEETVESHGLLVTGLGRTVVDIAGASPFEEGVMAADAALLGGTTRAALEAAVELAGPRRASRRIGDVVAFAHPGAESAAESRFRVTSMRLGLEVPELQHRVLLHDGEVFLDGHYRSVNVGVEVDGDQKYLDTRMAPDGPGAAVVREKRREDEVRLGLRALARIGWIQSGSAAALRTILTRVGVRPTRPRTRMQAYIEEARHAHPRTRPRVRRSV